MANHVHRNSWWTCSFSCICCILLKIGKEKEKINIHGDSNHVGLILRSHKRRKIKRETGQKKKKKKRDWRDMIWLAGRYCQLIKIHFIYLKSHLCQIFSFHAAPNHCIRSDYKSWIDITSLIWEKFQLVHLFWSIFFFWERPIWLFFKIYLHEWENLRINLLKAKKIFFSILFWIGDTCIDFIR